MARQRTAPDRRPPRSASRRKRERRREQQRIQAAPARRIGPVQLAAGVGGVVVVVGVVLAVLLTRGHASPSSNPTPSASATPAATPTPAALASLDTAADGTAAVDGLPCQGSETTTNESNAHLAIYVDGDARQVPAGIGIGTPRNTFSSVAGPFVSGKCYYPVLTHTGDGIVRSEPSTKGTTYTLGQFFDLWGQTLSATQAGPATGAVSIFVNGTQYSGDPRSLPLSAHAVIQIDVGATTAFQPYTFPAGD